MIYPTGEGFLRRPARSAARTTFAPIVRSGPRVERNAPRPYGSGVKYKRCCAAATAGPSALAQTQ